MKYTDIICLVLSDLDTNCYIVPAGKMTVKDDDGNDVIDPAYDAERIISIMEERELEPAAILLTHGHFDHTAAAKVIKEKKSAPIYIHKDDKELLSDSVKSLSFFCPNEKFDECCCTADDTFDNITDSNGNITFGELTLKVVHTPGHTEGSVCFLCHDEDEVPVMFSGDTLFKGSVGRTDCYKGDRAKLDKSLDDLMKAAGNENYVILPGHGEFTRLNTERKYNPFIEGF